MELRTVTHDRVMFILWYYQEAGFEKCIDTLATKLAPLCETAVPDAYQNMVRM